MYMYLYTHMYTHTQYISLYIYIYIYGNRARKGLMKAKCPGPGAVIAQPWTASAGGAEGALVLHVMLPAVISVPEGHLCFLRYVRLCQPANGDGGADETAICGALSLSWALCAPLRPTSRGHLGPWRSHVADRGPIGTENGAGAAPGRPHSESQPEP